MIYIIMILWYIIMIYDICIYMYVTHTYKYIYRLYLKSLALMSRETLLHDGGGGWGTENFKFQQIFVFFWEHWYRIQGIKIQLDTSLIERQI